MNDKYKYVQYVLSFASLFILIWSFGVLKSNHTNYVALVESYDNLVQYYEEHAEKANFNAENNARISYLKSDIDGRQVEGRHSSVKPELSKYYIFIFMGLAGLVVAELLQRWRSIEKKDSYS